MTLLVQTVLSALWIVIPVYVANSIPVLAGGGRPIDDGRRWRERRILGDGKTWRGAILGTVAGALTVLVLNQISSLATSILGLSVPAFPTSAVVALPLGAILGDIGASFVKRRMDRERGSPVPVLDQLDFILGALIVTWMVAPAWFGAVVTPGVAFIVLLITPFVHRLSNVAAYVMRLKDEPW